VEGRERKKTTAIESEMIGPDFICPFQQKKNNLNTRYVARSADLSSCLPVAISKHKYVFLER
jgi:hypothetical protein